MRHNKIAVEVFTVAAIYLMLAIPITSATSISVMFQNSPVTQIQLPEHVSISSIVADGMAKITLSKADKYTPQKVFMYPAREMVQLRTTARPLITASQLHSRRGSL